MIQEFENSLRGSKNPITDEGTKAEILEVNGIGKSNQVLAMTYKGEGTFDALKSHKRSKRGSSSHLPSGQNFHSKFPFSKGGSKKHTIVVPSPSKEPQNYKFQPKLP